jgi:hypothetical protein
MANGRMDRLSQCVIYVVLRTPWYQTAIRATSHPLDGAWLALILRPRDLRTDHAHSDRLISTMSWSLRPRMSSARRLSVAIFLRTEVSVALRSVGPARDAGAVYQHLDPGLVPPASSAATRRVMQRTWSSGTRRELALRSLFIGAA